MWIPVVIGAAVGALVGVMINNKKAKTQQGSSHAQYGQTVSKQPVQNNSNNSSPKEKLELGKAYMYYGYKKGISVNYQKAYELLSEVAALNNSEAMVELGNLCKSGNLGKFRYVEAKEWYEKAAALGNVTGICKLGYMYHYGLGTINNKAKAKELYKQAESKGSKEAKYRLLFLS